MQRVGDKRKFNEQEAGPVYSNFVKLDTALTNRKRAKREAAIANMRFKIADEEVNKMKRRFLRMFDDSESNEDSAEIRGLAKQPF